MSQQYGFYKLEPFFIFVILKTQCRLNPRRDPLQPKVLIPCVTATPCLVMLADETHKYVVNAKQSKTTQCVLGSKKTPFALGANLLRH